MKQMNASLAFISMLITWQPLWQDIMPGFGVLRQRALSQQNNTENKCIILLKRWGEGAFWKLSASQI